MGAKQSVDPTTISFVIRQKMNVMNAVMLRDMRTRFFNHGLGFIIQTLWPLTHMAALLLIYHFAGREAPFGNNLDVFFATGLVPTLTFMYISRFMSISLLINRSMLSFPAVKVTDIIFARAFLEVIANCLTVAAMFALLSFFGDDPRPQDTLQAVYAMLATILLGVGVGTLVSVIVMFAEIFVTVWALLGILFYISSGTLFALPNLPDSIAVPLSWNPITQCVEWMRSAYYQGYNTRLLDKEYLVLFGLTSLMIGLGLERFFRMKMYDS